jgi:hypothetical protein
MGVSFFFSKALTGRFMCGRSLEFMHLLVCPWGACPAAGARFNTEIEVKAHVEDHLEDLTRQWSCPSKCTWPNCPSKGTFRSRNDLKTHLRNKHLDPLVCTVPQCNYKKPFSKQHELNRHIETCHSSSHAYCCPIEFCGAKFPRNDKLLKHVRENHDMLRCLHSHCSVAAFKTQEETHQQLHGEFECALASCQRAPRSYFQDEGLRRHLQKHHKIHFWTANDILSRMGPAGDTTARECYLEYQIQDCSVCSKQQEDIYLRHDSEGINTQMG